MINSEWPIMITQDETKIPWSIHGRTRTYPPKSGHFSYQHGVPLVLQGMNRGSWIMASLLCPWLWLIELLEDHEMGFE